MKPSKVIRAFTLIASLIVATASAAETLYVGDVVYVPMRSGASPQHRIIHKGLKSGTALEVQEYNEDKSWALATTGELEGWVPTHYLTATPVSADLLEKANAQLNSLKSEHTALKTRSAELDKTLNSSKARLSQLERDKTQLTLELNRVRSVYSGAIELDQKYQELLEQHELLQTEKNALTAENDNLKSDQRISFMFYGALLILAGMIAITILPRFKPQKRNADWIN